MLAVAAVVMLSAAIAGSPRASAAVTVDGVVRTLAADTVDRSGDPKVFKGHSEDIYQQILIVGDKSYVLKGKKARNNAKVRVTGEIKGHNFSATSISTSGTAAGISDTGTTRVLTMLAYWTAPDSITSASAASQMFADTNGWYRDASYGVLGQAGDVTPWMSIAGPTTGCYADYAQLMSQAKAAAASLGYSASNYDNFVLYFPHCAGDADGFAGWAYVGAPDTWLNGYIDRRASVHEQGHNYGLWHSHSYMCSNGGLSGSCAFSDYGDLYDAMGSSGYVGHFNSAQKSLLHWNSSRIVNLTSGGTTTLAPMASDSLSPHTAVIALNTGRTYWLEYRQPIDYDASLPTSGTDGILVHVTGPGSGSSNSGASLIDVDLSNGITEDSSTLKSGQTWTTPEGTSITVGQVSASGANVSVSSGPAPVATLSPTQLTFGTVPVNTTSAASTVTLKNSGNTTMNISSIAVAGTNAADYVKGNSTCAATLAASASCTTQVTFHPSSSGSRSGSLIVTDNAAGSPHSVALSGTGGTATVPTVTAQNPAAGATGVSIGTTTTRTAMKATFSEAVTGVSGTSLTLKQGATAVSGAVTYDGTTHIATLTPAAPLTADKTYTLSLTSSIKSTSGGSLAAQSWNFITGPRPTITATTPALGATGVSIGTTTTRSAMRATFSEAVTGVSGTSFTLKQGTTAVSGAVTYDGSTRVATLTPAAPLAADKTYTLSLTSAIKDLAGNPVTTKTWTFITGPRPAVTNKIPASGATGVSRTANITATFNEPVTGIPTTAAASANFKIKQTSTGTAFTSAASYNTTTRVATLNPAGTLLAKTQYTVTMTSGVKDVAGNTLTALTWSFTTGA
jgi:hypothetical protein